MNCANLLRIREENDARAFQAALDVGLSEVNARAYVASQHCMLPTLLDAAGDMTPWGVPMGFAQERVRGVQESSERTKGKRK